MRKALLLLALLPLEVACTGGGVIGSDGPEAGAGHDGGGSHKDGGGLSSDSGSLPDVSGGDAGSHGDSSPPVDSGHAGDAGKMSDGGADAASPLCIGGEGTQGTVLASGQPSYLRGLAIDTTNVYWTTLSDALTPGIVAKVPKAGGAVTTLATDQTVAFDVVSDGANVYWTGGDATTTYVMTVPVGGGTPTKFWTTSGLFSEGDVAISLATDGTNLYWSNPGGNLVMAPLSGGSPTAFSVLGSTYVGVFPPSVYFEGAGSGEGLSSLPISAAGAPTGDPSPEILWSAGVGASLTLVGIKADATGVYWADQGGAPYDAGVIWALPAGTSTAIPLVTGISYLEAIAIDGTNVYWGDADGVSKVPIGGGSPTVVASDEPSTGNVQVDDAFVYFTNDCFGTVKKIAK